MCFNPFLNTSKDSAYHSLTGRAFQILGPEIMNDELNTCDVLIMVGGIVPQMIN